MTSRKTDVFTLGDFENRGQILASQKLTVESLGLRNLGVASSITGANVTLIAHHDALNEGTIGAITGVSIDSGGNLLSPGSIAVGGTAPANLDADATGDGSILLTAVGNVASGGDLIASGRVAIKGAEFEANTTKARLGGSAITIDVTGAFTSLGQTTSDGDISVKAASIGFGAFDAAKTFGTLTGKSVTLEARNGDISNKALISSAEDFTLKAVGHKVINAGVLAATTTLNVTSADYQSTANAELGGTEVTFRLTGHLANDGFISGTTKVDIEAGDLSNGARSADSRAGQILGTTITLGNATKSLGDLTNNGAIEAAGEINIHSGALTNAGSLISDTNAKLIIAGHVSNSGTIGSADILTLNAGSYTATGPAARVYSKIVTVDLGGGALDNAGTIYGSTRLTLTSGALTNRGTASAIGGKTATITTNASLWNEGEISGDDGQDPEEDALNLTVHGSVNNSGMIVTSIGNLTLAADHAVSSTGVLAATGALSITAASLSNATAGAQLGGSTVTASLSGDFNNVGYVNGGTTLSISSQGFSNGPLAGTAGLIVSNFVGISAGRILNLGRVESSGAATVVSGSDLVNTGSIIGKSSLLLISIGDVDNFGEIGSDATLTLLTADYSGFAGSALNGFDISANSQNFYNGGKIDARSLLTLNAASVSNAVGGKMSAYVIKLGTGVLDNAGNIESEEYAELTASGSLRNTGTIASEKSLLLTGTGAFDNYALIQAKDGLAVNGGVFTNRSSAKLQGKNVWLTSTNGMENAGIVDGSDQVVISASSFINQGASLANYASISSKLLKIDVTGDITLGANSLLQGTDDAIIKAAKVSSGFFSNNTAKGQFIAGRNLDFTLTQSGWTFDKDLKVLGNLKFSVSGDLVNNAVVAAGGTLDLISTAGSIINGSDDPANPGGGSIYSNGDMNLDAHDNIKNYASTIVTGGNLTLHAGKRILNTRTDTTTSTRNYVIDGAKPAYVTEVTMHETSGPASIDAMGNITATANTIRNVASSMTAGNNLTLVSNTTYNLARQFDSDGDGGEGRRHLWPYRDGSKRKPGAAVRRQSVY